jgi:flagellar biosynthesis GTPase FlhF
MSALTQPHTNGHDRELNGVRTYRGRKLEDLIPQIRAELGPDAIILRQREGLMGGVGGFFAQKCVEVDAQAAPHTPQIDIYDEDEPVNGWDEGLENFVAPSFAPDVPALPAPEPPAPVAAEPEPIVAQPEPEQPAPLAAEQPAPVAADQTPAPTARWAQEADAFVAPAAQEAVAPPAPAAEELTAESFVTRLEQAAAHVDIDELVKLVTSGRVLGNEAPVAPAPAATPEVAPKAASEAALAPAPNAPVANEPVAPPAAAPAAPEPVAPHLIAPEPIAPQPVASAPEPTPVVPPAATPWVAKQAGALDSDEAAAVTAELTAQGISESWAQQLIVAAAAHRSPLFKGSLRDAVRATLAAIVPAPAPLPANGAAVGFVGAGGAGKTRCVAALASAYAKRSTLASSVVSMGSDDWGGDLKELLKGQNVWVMGAANGPEAAPAVQHGRDGGLVVVDTAGATPRDPASVDQLAAELQSLNLDAVYIAVPATFSVHAARKLLDGFAALGADGIAVTHADEADQLGIAAELSAITGMPVAYIHDGLELDSALSAADPSALAARLLP